MDDKEANLRFEKELWSKGFKHIAGVDEAGRGPLAGPVVAGVVILPEGTKPFFSGDSKKLSKKERTKHFAEIFKRAVAVSYGIADSLEIDCLNIRRATLLAVIRAIENLRQTPDCLITDYIDVEGFKTLSLAKGDQLSFTCACASVVAKVVRDYIMEKVSPVFPHYKFHKNKGYPTKEHIKAIDTFGVTPIHRMTFARVKGKKLNMFAFPANLKERMQLYLRLAEEAVDAYRR